MTRSSPVRELHHDDAIIVRTWKNIFVAIYLDVPESASLSIAEELQARFVEVHREGMFALNVLRIVKLSRPPDHLREKSAQMLARFSPHLLGNALVIEVDGLIGGLARAFIAGMGLLAGDAKRPKVFKTVHEAIEWLASLPGASPALLAEGEALAGELRAA